MRVIPYLISFVLIVFLSITVSAIVLEQGTVYQSNQGVVYNETWADYINNSFSTGDFSTNATNMLTTVNTPIYNFTIAGWLYRINRSTGNEQTIFYHAPGTDIGGTNNGFWIKLGAGSNQYQLVVGLTNESMRVYTSINGVLPRERMWEHVAVVFRDGNLTAYINGKIGGSYLHSTSFVNNTINATGRYSSINITLGGTSASTWNRSLDNFYIFNTSLTTSEIIQLNNSGRGDGAPAITTGLKAYYSLRDANDYFGLYNLGPVPSKLSFINNFPYKTQLIIGSNLTVDSITIDDTNITMQNFNSTIYNGTLITGTILRSLGNSTLYIKLNSSIYLRG